MQEKFEYSRYSACTCALGSGFTASGIGYCRSALLIIRILYKIQSLVKKLINAVKNVEMLPGDAVRISIF